MYRWLLLILLTVILFELDALRRHREPESSSAAPPIAEVAPAPKPAPAAAAPTPAPKHESAPVLSSAAPIHLPPPEAARSHAPGKGGVAVYLPAEDELLDQLKARWEQLPREAYTTRAAGGWRIHFLERRNLFSELGLEDGDFIPQDQYEITQTDPRMTAINKKLLEAFRHIERN